ncbi:MAG: hypothetical protein WD872_17010, partial [Pirellulaceae bacterium]
MDVYLAVLTSPDVQLAALALLGTTVAQSLVALWAAISDRHWFVRALAVWGAVALLLPIRAYEPALLFAISSASIVAILSARRYWQARRREARLKPLGIPTKTAVRFGLGDLFLL